MPQLRIACPDCHAVLSVASLPRHRDSRKCLETQFPNLRAERLRLTRAARQQYDRESARLRREAARRIQPLQLAEPMPIEVIVVEVEDAPTTTIPLIRPAPTDVSATSNAPTVVQCTVQHSAPSASINSAGSDVQSDGVCPFCQSSMTNPVHPQSCSHLACADCWSEYIVHWIDSSNRVPASRRSRSSVGNPSCPLCRVTLEM